MTALGTSMAMVWNNLAVMIVWGAIVRRPLRRCRILTGFVGLIVVFPVLGHATWHAYRADPRRPPPRAERMFIQPA